MLEWIGWAWLVMTCARCGWRFAKADESDRESLKDMPWAIGFVVAGGAAVYLAPFKVVLS